VFFDIEIGRKHVFDGAFWNFSIETDGKPAGRIVMGLFGDVVPKTAVCWLFVEVLLSSHGFGTGKLSRLVHW
jgi:hypothetical protein